MLRSHTIRAALVRAERPELSAAAVVAPQLRFVGWAAAPSLLHSVRMDAAAALITAAALLQCVAVAVAPPPSGDYQLAVCSRE